MKSRERPQNGTSCCRRVRTHKTEGIVDFAMSAMADRHARWALETCGKAIATAVSARSPSPPAALRSPRFELVRRGLSVGHVPACVPHQSAEPRREGSGGHAATFLPRLPLCAVITRHCGK